MEVQGTGNERVKEQQNQSQTPDQMPSLLNRGLSPEVTDLCCPWNLMLVCSCGMCLSGCLGSESTSIMASQRQAI